MNRKTPLVTVLMPVHNAGKFIAEAIQSVLDQTFSDFELLIINDGSTDNTQQVIQRFTDERIRLLEQERSGVAAALNAGLFAARGNYIARFDADDICFPKRLEIQVDFLENHPDYILTGSDAEYIQENGEHLFDFHCRSHDYNSILENLYAHCPFIHSCVIYRKQAIFKAGMYPVCAHTFEDYLLWVRVVGSGKCCNLPVPLVKVRFNPGSVTIDEKWRSRRFRKLKQEIIRKGVISEEEGNTLFDIIKKQETKKIKQGSYHALCSKKFLTDNYQPSKARWHAGKAIGIHPLRLDTYALLLVSYFPEKWIKWINHSKPVNRR